MFEKKKPMSQNEMDAKRHVIESMRKMAQGAMGDKLKGLKKVSVASNSPAGLEEGLDKAKEMISMPAHDLEESPEHEASESPEEEMMEPDEESMSEEDIDKKIQELLMLKEKMKA